VRFPNPSKTAPQADAFLHSRGVIVRPVGGYGLADCLRITVGTEAQNRVLLDALQAFADA
jgi:histidinol-phosphate aminotransferase